MNPLITFVILLYVAACFVILMLHINHRFDKLPKLEIKKEEISDREKLIKANARIGKMSRTIKKLELRLEIKAMNDALENPEED